MGSYAAEEEAPIVLGLLVGFGEILAALLLWGLRYVLVDWLGFFLRKLASLFDLPFGIGNPIAGAVDWLLAEVGNHLGEAALACEGEGVVFLLGAWHLIVLQSEAIDSLATETLGALYDLRHIIVPRLVAEATGPLGVLLWSLRGRVEHAAAQAIHGIDELAHTTEVRLRGIDETARGEIARLDHAVDVTVPRAIAREGAGIREWAGDELGSLRKAAEARWRQVLELTSAGAIVAVVAREFPWLRCPNVNGVGRKLCNLPLKVLEDLLAGLVAALVVTDLCRMMTLAQFAARKTVPYLEKLILVDGAVCRAGGATFPSGYEQPQVATKSVPPTGL